MGWLFQPNRIHELNAYLHLYFGHLQVWDDLGIYVVVLLCLFCFFFPFVFIQGQILPSGTHVWFPWGSVPLMEITRMHPRARFFPQGFILPQCANIILIKINKNCTYASREEIDST